MLSGLCAADSFLACFFSLAKTLDIEMVAPTSRKGTTTRRVAISWQGAIGLCFFHMPLRQVARVRIVLHTNALLDHDARRDNE